MKAQRLGTHFLRRAVSAAPAFLLFACGGSSTPSNVDTRPCVFAPSALMATWGMTGDLSEPRRCPYVVRRPGDSTQFVINVRGPETYNTSSGFERDGYAFVKNVRNQQASQSYTAQSIHDPNPSNLTNRVLIQFIGKFAAGVGGSTASILPYDTAVLVLTAWYGYTGNVYATMGLPGNVDSTLGKSLVGSATIPLGSSASWSVATPRDTISYQYAWRINGQTQVGAVGNSFTTSFQSPGTRTLSAVSYRSDYSADTVPMSVSVIFTSTVSGKSTTKRPCALTYTTSVVGGIAPLTRVWKLNGQAIGTNSASVDLTVDWLGTQTLSATTTDNVGNVSSGSMSITGTSTGQCTQ